MYTSLENMSDENEVTVTESGITQVLHVGPCEVVSVYQLVYSGPGIVANGATQMLRTIRGDVSKDDEVTRRTDVTITVTVETRVWNLDSSRQGIASLLLLYHRMNLFS